MPTIDIPFMPGDTVWVVYTDIHYIKSKEHENVTILEGTGCIPRQVKLMSVCINDYDHMKYFIDYYTSYSKDDIYKEYQQCKDVCDYLNERILHFIENDAIGIVNNIKFGYKEKDE